MEEISSQITFFVDAHVHIYDCFDLDIFLSAAHDNFCLFDQTSKDTTSSSAYFLLLSEGIKDNWFKKIKQATDRDDFIANWSIKKTAEDITLRAQHKTLPDKKLFIVAGRQIITAENLEVLALFTDKLFTERNTLDKTIQAVRADNAIAVIPWGTGKWFGKRGQILKNYLIAHSSPPVYLGDNGGRPVFWPTPSLFNLAENYNTKILRGSDPLPFVSENRKAGSFCFSTTGESFPSTPSRDLQKLLATTPLLTNFGTMETPICFFKNQIAMQYIKRKHN